MWPRLIIVVALLAVGGCVDLGTVVPDETGGLADPTSPLDRGDGSPTSDLTVGLDISNSVPQVNEQVILACAVVDGDPSDVSFAFQSNAARLIVDTVRGRATFVVDTSDLGTEFEFTCTATSDNGTSPPSNRIVFIPIG